MSRPIVPPSARSARAGSARVKEILTLVIAVAVIVATALLGRWQLGRGDTKRRLAADIAQRAAMPALTQGPAALDFAASEWRPVAVRGSYAAELTVFLQNRQHDDQPGYWVLTPLRIAGSDTWIMVQRGWVPRGFDAYALQPKVPTPAGSVEVHGRIAPAPSQWFSFAKDPADAVVRQNIDLHAFAVRHHMTLLPYVVQQLGTGDDGMVRDWPAPDLGMATNYGYAAQWFAMSLLGIGLTAWFGIRRLRRGPPGDIDA